MILKKIYIKLVYLLFEIKKGRSSESDNGIYLNRIQKFLNSNSKFEKFKRDPLYCTILEHLSKDQGKEFLDLIEVLDENEFEKIKSNYIDYDQIGNPIKYNYSGIIASPNTLRYIKIACEIKQMFGNNIGKNIVEIGGGYGGQMVQIDRIFDIKKYVIYDLYLVNKLITKYTDQINTNIKPITKTLEEIDDTKFDFFISNYAFSELNKKLQMMYLRIIKNSKSGYMIMNSGDGGVYDKNRKLNKEFLLNQIPNSKVLKEIPLTYSNNYVLVWGI